MSDSRTGYSREEVEEIKTGILRLGGVQAEWPEGNYWYAEPDKREPPMWQAVLQLPGVCLSSEIFHQTAAECEEFIRDQILPATAHFEHLEASA